MRTLGELCDDDDEGSSAFCLEGCSLTDLAALIDSASNLLAVCLRVSGPRRQGHGVRMRGPAPSSEALRRLWASPLTRHLLASLSASQSSGSEEVLGALERSLSRHSLAHSLTCSLALARSRLLKQRVLESVPEEVEARSQEPAASSSTRVHWVHQPRGRCHGLAAARDWKSATAPGFAKAAWRADIRLRLVPRCTRRCVARQDTHPVAGMLGAKGSPPHMRSMRDAALRDSVLDPFHTACMACIRRAYSVLQQRA